MYVSVEKLDIDPQIIASLKYKRTSRKIGEKM
jgi:hypothetical protein